MPPLPPPPAAPAPGTTSLTGRPRADAAAASPASWLPLERVLQALHDCRRPGKLLLLDLRCPTPDPRTGLPEDDVASRALPLLKKATEEDAGLRILCSCGAGETPLL